MIKACDRPVRNRLDFSKLKDFSPIDRTLYTGWNSGIGFGKVFLRGDFGRSKNSPAHYKMDAELQSNRIEPTAFIFPREHAKFISLDEKVLTDTGWKKVKYITKDDKIYGSDGKTKKIIGLSKIVHKPLYKVTTRDGRSLIVSDDHLWTVRWLNGFKPKDNKYFDYTTAEIIEKYHRKRLDKRYNKIRDDYNLAIDCPEPIVLSEKNYLIDPYTLGAIIGDGNTTNTTPRIYSDEKDVKEMYSYINGNKSEIKYSDRCPRFSIKKIGRIIKTLGLDVTSHKKFIPLTYLNGSIEQRIELLRGLMDTDGTICLGKSNTKNHKTVAFSTVSEMLADDIIYLVRSLGGYTVKTFHENNYAGYYYVGIHLKINPFKLKRKANNFIPCTRLYNAITNVEFVKKGYAKCLKVDSSDELFIANNFLLTHNTTIIKCHVVRDFAYTKDNMTAFGDETKCGQLKDYWYEEAEMRQTLFYGWVADRQKKSVANVRYIKNALTINQTIVSVFGNMDGSKGGYMWTAEDVITINNDKLCSRSNLTSIRGETHDDPIYGTIRFIRLFGDDFENEDNTRSEKRREYILDVLMDGIYPAVDKDIGRMVLMQTPVHWGAFGQSLIEMHHRYGGNTILEGVPWRIYVYPVTQPKMEGGVLWHDHYPREKLDRIKAEYAASKKGLSGYYQEYELQVQSDETALFTDKHIRFYHGNFTLEYGSPALVINGQIIPVLTFGGCDPSTDIETKDSDYSVMLVMAIDAYNNIYVLEYVRELSIPTMGIRNRYGDVTGKKGVVDYIFELYDKYKCESFTIEDVGITRSIFKDLNQNMENIGNYNYSFIGEEPAGRNKINKIYSGLNSLFALRKIHYTEGMLELLYETKTFGKRMSHDDTIESLLFAITNSYIPSDKPVSEKDINKKRKRNPDRGDTQLSLYGNLNWITN